MFNPAAAARCNTSSVAIMVVAMPFTGVSALPAIMLSTVCCRHGIPKLFLMRSMIWPAVRFGRDSCARAKVAAAMEPAITNSRREDVWLMMLLLMSFYCLTFSGDRPLYFVG